MKIADEDDAKPNIVALVYSRRLLCFESPLQSNRPSIVVMKTPMILKRYTRSLLSPLSDNRIDPLVQ